MATDFKARRSGLLVPKAYSDTYQGAKPSPKRKWLATVTTDSKRVLTPYVLRVLRSRARQEFANNGFVRGAFMDVARYLIGHNGIKPQWQTSDDGWNREMELRWANWLNICDIRRKLHGNQIFRAASVEMDCDGDFGIVLTETGGGDSESPGIAQIQTVRAHRIDDDRTSSRSSTAGVVEDSIGRTLGYNVIQGDSDKPRFIPAESFILLGDPELSDWSRYPSAIAHGLNLLQDGAETMGHIRDGIKTRTARPFFHKTPLGEVDDIDPQGDTEEVELGDGVTVTFQDMMSGMIPRLGEGEEIIELKDQFPGGHVIPLLEFDRRDFACGYGVPLETIWKGDLGGPAQRFFITKFQRRIDDRCGLVFVPHLLKRLAGYFASKEIKRGAMPSNPEWWKIRWRPTSPKVTIDIGREGENNRRDLLLGSRTLEKDTGEQGEDWQDVREQTEKELRDLLQRAKGISEEFGVDIREALSWLSQRSQGSESLSINQLLQPQTPPARSESAEPLDE